MNPVIWTFSQGPSGTLTLIDRDLSRRENHYRPDRAGGDRREGVPLAVEPERRGDEGDGQDGLTRGPNRRVASTARSGIVFHRKKGADSWTLRHSSSAQPGSPDAASRMNSSTSARRSTAFRVSRKAWSQASPMSPRTCSTRKA